jgi:hypothetical protein
VWMHHLGLQREALSSSWRVCSDVVQAMSGARKVGREIEEEKRKEAGLNAFRLDQKQAEKRALGLMEREMKVAESRALAGETGPSTMSEKDVDFAHIEDPKARRKMFRSEWTGS